MHHAAFSAAVFTLVLAAGNACAWSSGSTAEFKGGQNHSNLLNEGEAVEDKNALIGVSYNYDLAKLASGNGAKFHMGDARISVAQFYRAIGLAAEQGWSEQEVPR